MATEESQVQINPIKFWKQVVLSVSGQLDVMSKELAKVQSTFPSNATGEVAAAHTAYQDLVENVKLLSAISAQSEASIAAIISRPEQLNYLRAKMVDNSVIAVNSNELISSINKLEYTLSRSYKYGEVGAAMELINAEFQHLEIYSSIPRIDALRKRYNTIKLVLRRSIFRDFRDLGQITELEDRSSRRLSKQRVSSGNGSSKGNLNDSTSKSGDVDASSVHSAGPHPLDALQDAHRVVTAMGPEYVVDLMDQVCQLQLLPYNQVGSSGGFLFSLHTEALEKRWTGLRKLIHAAETKMADICPASWFFPHRIYLEFATRTKEHLAALLQQAEMKEDLDEKDHVSLLVNSLKSVLKIQEEMTSRFEESTSASLDVSDEVNDLLAQIGQGDVISSVYDDFMGPYVILERRSLEEMIRNLASQDNAALATSMAASLADPKGGDKLMVHYESAPRMFEAIKASMKRCIALTTGQPFVNLSKQYRNCIQLYANALKSRCPDPVQAVKGPGQSALSYKLNNEIEMTICRVICTAEYCGEVVPQMETLIKEKVHPWLADQVNLNEQGDIFNDLAAHAIGILVSGVSDKLEEPFKVMRKINWANFDSVGDDSPYVGMLKNILVECMPRMKIALSATYFRNFATKVACALLSRFESIVLSRKRIGTTGADQLHLDITSIVSFLRDVHNLGTPANSSRYTQIPSTHITVISNQSSHIINILKLVATEEDQLEAMFHILIPTGDAALLSNIQQLKQGRDVLTSSVDAIGSGVNKIGDTTKIAVGATVGGTVKAINSVGKETTKAFSAVGGGTTKAFSAVGGGIGSVSDKMGDGLMTMGESTKQVFGKVGDKTFGAFKRNSLMLKKPFDKFKSPKKDEDHA